MARALRPRRAGHAGTLPRPDAARLSSLSRRGAARPSRAALQGRDAQLRRARAAERRVRRGVHGARRRARRPRRAAAAQLSAVLHRRVRRVEDRRDRRAAQPDLHRAEIEAALREQRRDRDRHPDALLRSASSALQPRTPLRQVIATNIKDYFPPLLRLLFTLFREKKDGDRIAIAAGDHDFGALLRRHARRRRTRVAAHAGRSGRAADERRHDGHAQGARSARTARTRSPACRSRRGTRRSCAASSDVFFVPLPLFHVYANVGIQALAFVNGSPLALVPNPRDLKRSARDDPAREADVLQRRADALHRAPESPRRAGGQGRLQVDHASASPAQPR